MDKTEVTNAQYEKCVDEGCLCCTAQQFFLYPQLILQQPRVRQLPGDPCFGSTTPATIVTGRVGYYRRKPSGEKATLGPRLRAVSRGNTSPTCDLVNGEVDGSMCVGEATEVGSYPSGASPYDVMDMAGNVWGGCETGISKPITAAWTFLSIQLDPNTGTHRVIRGGSFSYDVYFLRTAYRNLGNPDYRINYVGFRCAAPARLLLGC